MSPLPLTCRFEVPARHPHADAAGVVSIPRSHLDALPHCLLSIAAQQSPAAHDQVVRLSAWPEPSLAVFKGVVNCLMKCGSGDQLDTLSDPIPPGELLKALDYFIVPETLWPVGLIVMAAKCQGYNAAAKHIMATIKTDYITLAKEDIHEHNTKRVYYVGESLNESDEHDFWIRGDSSVHFSETPYMTTLTNRRTNKKTPTSSYELPNPTLSPFPKPLKERLQRLADAEFLQITFNPEEKTSVCPHLKQPNSMCPWSFTTDVDIP